MSIISAIPNTLLTELGNGLHDFRTSGNTFKCALYTGSASLGAGTTVYTTSNEVTGTGYTAGGNTLTTVNPTISNSVGVYDFADLVFSALTVTGIRGCLIYNSNNGNRTVAVLNFVNDQSPSVQDFTITFPGATSTGAIIRIKRVTT